MQPLRPRMYLIFSFSCTDLLGILCAHMPGVITLIYTHHTTMCTENISYLLERNSPFYDAREKCTQKEKGNDFVFV